MVNDLARNARRRARRQRPCATAAIIGPASHGDIGHAVVEEVIGAGWRVRSGKVVLAQGFTDRTAAQRFLDALEQKDITIR